MAAKTPSTLTTYRAGTATQYVDPRGGSGDNGTTTFNSTKGLNHYTFYMENVDDTDTFTSGIDGIERVAFETYSTDACSAFLTTIGTGLITFQTGAIDQHGVLHVWARG